jgi:hypothetical protein
MSKPVWITQGGNLGTFPELEFYSLPLEVYEPTGTPVTFSFLSGELPPGLQVIKSGVLQGVPVVTNPGPSDETRTYKFTIRASAQTPTVVVDRTFSFTVSNIIPPQIIPETQLLGEFFDGTLINRQLYAREVNPEAVLVWSIKDGELPPGLQLTTDGVLVGFIGQYTDPAWAGRVGYDAQPTQVPVLFSAVDHVSVPDSQTFGNGQPYSLETVDPFGDPQKYQEFPYDYSNTSHSTNKEYTFTVQVFDGANYDTQIYSIKVVAKGSWTTDNDINTIDDDIITTDADQLYIPIITTSVGSLPTVRQNSNFSFKFSAVDFYSTNPLYWQSNITTWLPNLSIDANTGWVSGHIDTQEDYKKIYNFYVTAANIDLISTSYVAGGYANTNLVVTSTQGIRSGMEVHSPTFTNVPTVVTVYSDENIVEISTATQAQPSGNISFYGNLVSVPVNYQLTVLGDVNNLIVWDTPTLVGTIVNGGVSELSIVAHNTLGKDLSYKLVHGTLNDGSPATDNGYSTPTLVKLPQGLELLPSGHIVGRASFRHFQFDADNTTIDGGATQFDNIYTFTVQAEAVDGTVADTKTFNIRINNLYTDPYENLYMQALTTIDQRRLFADIVSDPSLFPDSSIYRIDDPNYGKAKEIKFLAVPGVAASKLSEYTAAMQKNFHNKRITFSEIKTAIATDPNNNYAIKYEVVYVDIVDPFNPSNADVKLETDLFYGLNKIRYPYYDALGASYHVLDPNTFDNMETRISSNLGYSAQGVIPDWMTSVQEDKTVLGFKRAVVLAYTKPGEAKKIAWRIQNKGISMNTITFTADRYVLDNALSTNYDIDKQVFLSSRETTFDYLVLSSGQSYNTVDYAVSQPFASINNQTISIINANGGVDGVTSFRDGDRLVFAQQEGFDTNYQNDGWVYFKDLFMGNYSDPTDSIDQAYYDSTSYDESYVIPGYVEKNADNKSPTLLAAVNLGDTYLYVPYIASSNYVGKSINANSFIDYNTKIIAQVADNSTGTLGWKLTIDVPAIGTALVGQTIKIESFMVVTAVDGNTITVDAGSMPVTIADKLELIQNAVSGYGIPPDTRIISVNDNVIALENFNGLTAAIRAGDYLNYYVQNQRAGVWQIVVESGTELVRLEFIKELNQGAVIKVLDGRSHGQSFMEYSHSIASGDTVPKYAKIPNVITFNGADGGRTSFDSGGTRFFDRRDHVGDMVQPEILPWVPNINYAVGSRVIYQNHYYRATVNVPAAFTFVQSTSWERFDLIPTSGDKYIKFPKIGVFN